LNNKSANGCSAIFGKVAIEYLINKENRKVVDDLFALGITFAPPEPPVVNGILKGESFTITGSFPNISRSKLKEDLIAMGAKVTGRITRKTTGVFVGENPGSTYQKALDRGLKIFRDLNHLK